MGLAWAGSLGPMLLRLAGTADALAWGVFDRALSGAVKWLAARHGRCRSSGPVAFGMLGSRFFMWLVWTWTEKVKRW